MRLYFKFYISDVIRYVENCVCGFIGLGIFLCLKINNHFLFIFRHRDTIVKTNNILHLNYNM